MGHNMTAQRADAIWDTVCYIGADGDPFKSKTVIDTLIRYYGGPHKTWEIYWYKYRNWAMDNPEEFSGPASKIERLGFGLYRLGDNPER